MWSVAAGGARLEVDSKALGSGGWREPMGDHQGRHVMWEEEENVGMSQEIVKFLPSQRKIRRAFSFPN